MTAARSAPCDGYRAYPLLNRGKYRSSIPRGESTVESRGRRSRGRLHLALLLSFRPGVVYAHPMCCLATPARPARRRRAPHLGQPVDEAALDRPRGRSGRRSYSRSRRSPAGERAPAPAGARPQPDGQAAHFHPAGSRLAGPPRQPSAHLGRRAPHRPARDRAALAPPGIPAALAAEVGAALSLLPARARHHRSHPADGARQPALGGPSGSGASCSSSISA